VINLLIVDDEDIIRNGLIQIDWASKGIRVVAAVRDGMEALEALEKDLIDVVLTDIRMPGMDGIAIVKFAREKGLATEFILLSGYGEFEYARQAIQFGVSEYLLKPSSPEEILRAVNRAAGSLEENRKRDLRLRMLEAELGKRQLIRDDDGLILGELSCSSITGRIFQFLRDRYREQVSLSDLSSHLNYSPIYLSKVIKKDTGYTFLDLLNGVRCHEAAVQLRSGETGLVEICEGVGIGDPRYFCQVFKRYYGVTPSAYRKTPVVLPDEGLACLIQAIREDS